MKAQTLKIGGRYNWRNQPERLIYVGIKQYHNDPRPWYQFDKADKPGNVYCEVLDSDLHMIEETQAASSGDTEGGA